jgi:hypothetical protein
MNQVKPDNEYPILIAYVLNFMDEKLESEL